MSDESDPDPTEAERRDLLISASLDGELTTEEAETLGDALTRAGDASDRAREFATLDQELRSLAEDSISDERLEMAYARLRSRLTHEAGREWQSASGTSLVGRWALAIGVAAAAAIALAWLLPGEPRSIDGAPAPDARPVVAEAFDTRRDGVETAPEFDLDAGIELDEALMLAIGYGDETSEVGSISSEDLEVIEQLDLLDHLLSRERRPERPREKEERG